MSDFRFAFSSHQSPLELWAGPECTVNRVGDRIFDQFAATGHLSRASDVELLKDLGCTAVRYPVSWERIAPDDPAQSQWGWTDDRLLRLGRAGLRVIAGLVHHGGGPRYTDLLDENFAVGLAAHAEAAARRYPWIEDWTPVNEPVTTARFSALYGHWYPHHRSERSFWLALLNQIDATRLAMRAIRGVQTAARLIQTEDVGRTYATRALRDQAGFDNVRRWAGFDLLCGRVVPGHALWRRLSAFGLGDRLRAIADDPCPPDIIGINHYLTSDRFLDHRIQRYPGVPRGGNGRRTFVDVEAVRALVPPPQGLSGAIEEVWSRYRLPLALTEVHNACTRDEQMRWLAEAWRAAKQARAQGIDLRAVTAWATFGSVGWDTLLTKKGRREVGAWETSGTALRPTAIVGLSQSLACTGEPAHWAAGGKGWWQRDIRLHHPAAPRPASLRAHRVFGERGADETKPILVVGATGTLGQALAAACRHRGLAHILTSRAELDLGDLKSIVATLDRHAPPVVINAAGWVRVDEAEVQEAACFEANAWGAIRLAEACAERGIATATFSSDLVFPGRTKDPYDETDSPAPLNVYGRSKAAAEQVIGQLAGCHLVVRTAAFFSPFDEHNFAVQMCRALAAGRRFPAAADQIITPTYVPDLCNAVLDLVIDGEAGIWHLTNDDAYTWHAFAMRIADAVGVDAALIDELRDASSPARRPAEVPLTSTRGTLMPSLTDAISRFARDWRTLNEHGERASIRPETGELPEFNSDPPKQGPSRAVGLTCSG